MNTTKLRTSRVLEWVGCAAPQPHLICFVDDCESEYMECRETPEGVFCLEHFMQLESCYKCGRAGTRPQHQRGHPDGSVICRLCYCGDVQPGYIEDHRANLSAPQSALCEVAAEIYDWTDVLDPETSDQQ